MNAFVDITKKYYKFWCALFTAYVIVHGRFTGYFMYRKFKKGKLEGNLHPRTDNEGPGGGIRV